MSHAFSFPLPLNVEPQRFSTAEPNQKTIDRKERKGRKKM
jgi:hypothetical protein